MNDTKSGWLVENQVVKVPVNETQMELNIHGSYQFPFALYYDILSRKELGFVNWHWHKELQFCLVVEGPITFSVTQDRYTLQSGEGILINSRRLHMAKPEQKGNGIYICYDFDPKLLQLFTGSIFEEKYVTPYLNAKDFHAVPLSPGEPWQQDMLEQLHRIYDAYAGQEPVYELRILSHLFRLWADFCAHKPVGQKETRSMIRHRDIVLQILSYIKEHYAEDFSMADLSRSVCYSMSECCRIFKHSLSETIYHYLNVYRVEKASGLLRATDYPVSRIAYDVGFSSTSYFIKCFKAITGQTPLQYRKKHQE